MALDLGPIEAIIKTFFDQRFRAQIEGPRRSTSRFNGVDRGYSIFRLNFPHNTSMPTALYQRIVEGAVLGALESFWEEVSSVEHDLIVWRVRPEVETGRTGDNPVAMIYFRMHTMKLVDALDRSGEERDALEDTLNDAVATGTGVVAPARPLGRGLAEEMIQLAREANDIARELEPHDDGSNWREALARGRAAAAAQDSEERERRRRRGDDVDREMRAGRSALLNNLTNEEQELQQRTGLSLEAIRELVREGRIVPTVGTAAVDVSQEPLVLTINSRNSVTLPDVEPGRIVMAIDTGAADGVVLTSMAHPVANGGTRVAATEFVVGEPNVVTAEEPGSPIR